MISKSFMKKYGTFKKIEPSEKKSYPISHSSPHDEIYTFILNSRHCLRRLAYLSSKRLHDTLLPDKKMFSKKKYDERKELLRESISIISSLMNRIQNAQDDVLEEYEELWDPVELGLKSNLNVESRANYEKEAREILDTPDTEAEIEGFANMYGDYPRFADDDWEDFEEPSKVSALTQSLLMFKAATKED